MIFQTDDHYQCDIYKVRAMLQKGNKIPLTRRFFIQMMSHYQCDIYIYIYKVRAMLQKCNKIPLTNDDFSYI